MICSSFSDWLCLSQVSSKDAKYSFLIFEDLRKTKTNRNLFLYFHSIHIFSRSIGMKRSKIPLVFYFLCLLNPFDCTKSLLSSNSTAEFLSLNNYSKVLDKSLPEVLNNLGNNVSEPRNFFGKSTKKAMGSPVFLLELHFEIDKFLFFEPRNGYIEVTAMLQYKWWNKHDPQSEDQLDLFQPVISLEKLRDNKDYNIQVNDESGRYRLLQIPIQILARKQQRSGDEEEVEVDTVFDDKYAALEQNVTIMFKCQHGNSSLGGLDTSRFPFDSYSCSLNLDLEMKPIGRPKISQRNSLKALIRYYF